MAQAEVLTLSKELARKIVQLLSDQSCRDICSATLACKAFWEWGNALPSVKATEVATKTPRRPSALTSLLRFQSRRVPLGLKVS